MRAFWVGVLSCSLLTVSSARAQAPNADVLQAARAAFKAGTALTKNAQWADALAAYERSASLHAHATTTFNIAFCERALGRYTRARLRFQAALDQNTAAAGDELDAALIQKSKGYITELDAKVGRVKLTLRPVETAIAIDGRPLEAFAEDGTMVAGTRPPGSPEVVGRERFDVIVDPGDHVIHLELGAEEQTRRISVAAGDWIELDIRHTAADVAQPTPPDYIGAFAAWGLGGAALVAGVVAGAIAVDRRNELGDRCANRNACPLDAKDDIALMQSASDISTAGFVVGGATAALGAVLFFTADLDESAEVRVGPNAISLNVRF